MSPSRIRVGQLPFPLGALRGALRGETAARSDAAILHSLVIVLGLTWAVLFIVVGLWAGLQMYADGSIFAYSVAVQDAWAFHYRNISGRLFVYLFAFLPAETFVGLTGDARGGIAIYGLLQFSAQLLGLAATFAADRSQGRIIFAAACGSTAVLCPFVFGFPTELWMAHAVFWPALAANHYARAGVAAALLMFALMLALVLTHGGGLIFAFAIVMTLLLRGPGDARLRRAGLALLAALTAWAAVKIAIRPDAYFGSVVFTAALMLIDPANLTRAACLVMLAGLACYVVAFVGLQRLGATSAHLQAVLIAATLLAAYWLWFDRALHADDRYLLRTALLGGTPVFGAFAAALALRAEGRLTLPVPLLPQVMTWFVGANATRAAIGALALVTLVHAVETVKFVGAWTRYKDAVRALAIGPASDPVLGDRRFVSSARIGDGLNRLSWFSTTPYLSVLLAPNFAPARLVVDPEGDYFWLSCATAKGNEAADRAVPVASRRLVRIYSCLHR